MSDYIPVVISVLLGGGFIGGLVLLLKLRPEAGEINVRAAEQVVLIQSGQISRFQQLIDAAEKRCDQRIAEAVADLTAELNRRPTRYELLDINGKLRTQLLAEGITPGNGP
jgi:hypothetical protein